MLCYVMDNINRGYKWKMKQRKIVLNELMSGSTPRRPADQVLTVGSGGALGLESEKPVRTRGPAPVSSVGGWTSSREEFMLFFDKLTDKPALRHCQGM